MDILKTEYISIEKLKAWDKNPRLHNLDSIAESIKEFGFRDPISINENNSEIEEGHGRLNALKKLKQDGAEPPEFIIKQNGTWLVPIQRFNDSELNQKRYSLAHNRTQELGEYDEPLLLENLVDLKDDLFATGYTNEDIDLLNEKLNKDDNNIYSKKIQSPVYEPKNEKPKHTDLFDETRVKELISEIEKSEISKDDKNFLIKAAKRHCIFNYELIADYYAHSSKEVQELMENSALIIIDFNKAIELGYVKLSEEIADQYRQDYGE